MSDHWHVHDFVQYEFLFFISHQNYYCHANEFDKQVRGKCSVYTLSVSQVILDLLAIIFTLKIIFLLSAAHSFYRLNVDTLQLLYVTDLHSRVLITFLNEESFLGVVRCVEWMSGRGDDDMPQH